jgi:hypothetical protein
VDYIYNHDNRYLFKYIINLLVGYGDYFPNTNYGRLILLTTAFIGTILISIIVVALQTQLLMNFNENNAFNFFERIKEKAHIQRKSAMYFKSTFQFLRNRNKLFKYIKEGGSTDNPNYQQLKDNIVYQLYQRIKANKQFKQKFQ